MFISLQLNPFTVILEGWQPHLWPQSELMYLISWCIILAPHCEGPPFWGPSSVRGWWPGSGAVLGVFGAPWWTVGIVADGLDVVHWLDTFDWRLITNINHWSPAGEKMRDVPQCVQVQNKSNWGFKICFLGCFHTLGVLGASQLCCGWGPVWMVVGLCSRVPWHCSCVCLCWVLNQEPSESEPSP